jgi:hypothetical protein
MERCPYCGASVRNGARFCTSCGRRLTGSNDEATVAAAAASPESDNVQERADQPVAWDSVPTSVERPAPANEDWPRRTPVASADLWPPAARESEPPIAVDPPSGGGDSDRTGDEPGIPAWTSSPWSSWAMPPAVEESGAEVDLADVGMVDDPVSGQDGAFAAADEPVEPAAPPAVAPAATRVVTEGGSGDAFGRAIGLVDELRALLPAVAGLEGVDVGGALAVLRAARSPEGELSTAELDSLVASVEAARARPREIDALLGLAGSLDGLAVMVTAHQRLSGAIDEAVALLGGAPPAPAGDDPAGSAGEA